MRTNSIKHGVYDSIARKTTWTNEMKSWPNLTDQFFSILNQLLSFSGERHEKKLKSLKDTLKAYH